MLAENPVNIKQEEKNPTQHSKTESAKLVVKTEEEPSTAKTPKPEASAAETEKQANGDFSALMNNPFLMMARNSATSHMQNFFTQSMFQNQTQLNNGRQNLKNMYPMPPFMMTPQAQMFYGGMSMRGGFPRYMNPLMMQRQNYFVMPSTMTGMQPMAQSSQTKTNGTPSVGISSSVGYQKPNGSSAKENKSSSPMSSRGTVEPTSAVGQPLMSQQAVEAAIKEGNVSAEILSSIFEKDVVSLNLKPQNFKLLDLENKWIPLLSSELDVSEKEAHFGKQVLSTDTAYKVFSYIIKYFGYLTYEEMSKELTTCFGEGSKIYNAFMALIERYQGVQKTKEENIKFVLRKAFKFMKDKVKGDCKDEKDAKRLFLEFYFNCPGISEEELESLIMPFTKKSQLKTMNLKYLKLIFSSPAFVKDYLSFLDYFDVITKAQNENKIKGACSNFLRFFKANNMDKIKKLRILPWLNSWINDTTKIAYYLMKYSSSPVMKLSCQVKYEFYINQNLQEKMKSFAPRNSSALWHSNLMTHIEKQRQGKISVEETLKRKMKYLEEDCASGSSGYEQEQAESPEKISKRIKFEAL